MRSFILILAFTWTLNWIAPASNPTLTQYVVERHVGATWIPVDTFASVPGACLDSFPGTPNEVWSVKARALEGTTRSAATLHLLAIDWAPGYETASTFDGRGVLPHTWVRVWLPSPRWTCTFAFADSTPTYVRCICDFDYVRDGKIDLSDFVDFGIRWNGDITELAFFGALWQKAADKRWP